MKMKEFAEIIKESHIWGSDKTKIVYLMFQAAGAKEGYRTSSQSPSKATIQNWLNEKNGKPEVSRYFPNFIIEDEKGARNFLKKDHWIELRDLFKEWHNS